MKNSLQSDTSILCICRLSKILPIGQRYNQTVNFKKLSIVFCVLIAGFLLALTNQDLQKNFKGYLRSYLTSVDDLKPGQTYDVVYVLGGGQESLIPKFKRVARLYSQGRFQEVAILSRPGRTEYDRKKGRNLTNDEWSLQTLGRYGLPRQSVRTISVHSSFFGTFSEAQAVARMAPKNNWEDLLLISSPHHTRRVRESFQTCLESSEIRIQVISSRDDQSLGELLREIFKLTVYELLLLQ